MNLSKNFSVDELIKSQTAERKGIDNSPNADALYNLRLLAENILQPIRDHFGPFIVSSGYRSTALCEAIGSKPTSQHAFGQAGDFEVPGIDNYDLCKWIEDNLEFDQLILECYKPGHPNSGWVHCSTDESPRKELLTYDRTRGYRSGLIRD